MMDCPNEPCPTAGDQAPPTMRRYHLSVEAEALLSMTDEQLRQALSDARHEGVGALRRWL
jgi:hypothetical protein